MADTPEAASEQQQQTESPQERLTDLSARATALYAVKKYEEAAELYSEATEIQAEVNGEMAEENADLLFAYGRCLFFVAQKTSTVLGGTAASAQLKGADKKPSKKRRANGTIKPDSSSSAHADPGGPSTSIQPITETSEPADVVPAVDQQPEPAKSTSSGSALFKIEGDAADWADSDEEEEGDEGDAEADEEEEDDDFSTAFEILDISRILYLRKLERLAAPDDQSTRDLKIRISDIYDLQAEISLEGEKFDAAVSDLRSCLEFKESLYPADNAILAECHYKLSLALEAASQVQQRDGDGNPVGEISIDWKLRNEAVAHQEKAIQSCQLRIEKEQKALENLPDDKKQKAKEQIEDVQDMTSAMEQRLEELKKPPVSVKAEAEKDVQQDLMGSVLGQLLGSGGADEQKAKLAEVMAGAKDLSGMVKKKKKAGGETTNESISTSANGSEQAPQTQPDGNAKGKRKAEEVDPGEEPAKKVRVERGD